MYILNNIQNVVYPAFRIYKFVHFYLPCGRQKIDVNLYDLKSSFFQLLSIHSSF